VNAMDQGLRRIALTWLSTGRGGAEQSVRELAVGLSGYGLQVTLLWWSAAGDVAGPLPAGIAVHQVTNGEQYAVALAGIVADAAADTVVISSHRTALVDLNVSSRRSVPVVPVLRALLVFGHPIRVAAPDSLRIIAVEPGQMPWSRLATAACWVGVSEASARSLTPYLPPTVSVRAICNGVSVRTTIPTDTCVRTTGQVLRCAAVARSTRWKRVAALIGAFAAVPPNTARLDVYGDGPDFDRLRSASTRLAGSVQFHGHVTDLHNRLAGADVLVSAARLEAFGRGIAEAAAIALPAIVPTSAASSELVLHGLTGWLYDPDEPGALSSLIGDVAALSPTDLAAVGRRAQARAAGLFTARRCAAEYLSLCHALAAASPAPTGRTAAA
jgi:glycosyltransferase involved in cell wall biosynthesis